MISWVVPENADRSEERMSEVIYIPIKHCCSL